MDDRRTWTPAGDVLERQAQLGELTLIGKELARDAHAGKIDPQILIERAMRRLHAVQRRDTGANADRPRKPAA